MDERRRRGVEDPLATIWFSEVISSPLAEGPADEKEPLMDLLFSVEAVPWLSLRLRRRYFSMASASRSRTRLANGESAEAGVMDGKRLLLDGWRWGWELEFEVADGWEGDEALEWLLRGPGAKPSPSPLSSVFVVLLVPEPLRILLLALMLIIWP
jgi:hypothetical protein